MPYLQLFARIVCIFCWKKLKPVMNFVYFNHGEEAITILYDVCWRAYSKKLARIPYYAMALQTLLYIARMRGPGKHTH